LTIDARARAVRLFQAWLGEGDILQATAEDVELFLDSRKIGPKARYTYISNLHIFYRWAIHAGRAEKDPTADIVRPRLHPGLPRPINDADLDQALTMAGPETRLILSLAAFEGMRCCEIGRLVREDIHDDRDPAVIVARGKGDKPRVIPLHPDVTQALLALPAPRTGPVLRTDLGRALHGWKISAMGNGFLHGIGLDATMHRLRHWFGTNLYSTSGRDLLMVKDLMGHSSMTTTTVYAAFDRANAPQAVMALTTRPHAMVVT
jgi:integrase/recombinase XerC